MNENNTDYPDVLHAGAALTRQVFETAVTDPRGLRAVKNWLFEAATGQVDMPDLAGINYRASARDAVRLCDSVSALRRASTFRLGEHTIVRRDLSDTLDQHTADLAERSFSLVGSPERALLLANCLGLCAEATALQEMGVRSSDEAHSDMTLRVAQTRAFGNPGVKQVPAIEHAAALKTHAFTGVGDGLRRIASRPASFRRRSPAPE